MGDLSNQAVAAAGVVYFLALLAHLVEWSSLRTCRRGRRAASVRGAAGGRRRRRRSRRRDRGAAPTRPTRRPASALFGRLGLLLTGDRRAPCTSSAWSAAGMAADPNRVPWGNMYEFTLSGHLRGRAALPACCAGASAWPGWRRSSSAFVLALLMVAVLWLYDPVAPLTEALDSLLAGDPRRLGDHRHRRVHPRRHHARRSTCVKARAARRRATGSVARVPAPAVLDRVSYRIHAFGFPVWTFAVLITGPIWAHQAWSSYWNWDPKEVWAFITWVVYAAYLHARSTAGWKGRNAAILALVGLATLWFNFIGINYFSTTSQHSYAAPALGRRVERRRPLTDGRRLRRRAAGQPRCSGSLGVLRVLALAVEVAQEVGVVVGAERARRRARRRGAAAGDAAALDHAHGRR